MTGNSHDARIYSEIVQRMNARYMTVRPHGIEVEPKRKLLTLMDVRVINHGGARTLYRNRQPVCRSLNGINPLAMPDKRCVACSTLPECTRQIRLDFLFEGMPYRLLLAFTSANNFLLYVAHLIKMNVDLREVQTRIKLIHRGTWGELRFEHRPNRSE